MPTVVASPPTMPALEPAAPIKTTQQKIEEFYGVKQMGDEVVFSVKFDQAKKVQTIGMVGISGQKTSVKPLRLGEMPGLMVSCRFRQQRCIGRAVCGSRRG